MFQAGLSKNSINVCCLGHAENSQHIYTEVYNSESTVHLEFNLNLMTIGWRQLRHAVFGVKCENHYSPGDKLLKFNSLSVDFTIFSSPFGRTMHVSFLCSEERNQH